MIRKLYKKFPKEKVVNVQKGGSCQVADPKVYGLIVPIEEDSHHPLKFNEKMKEQYPMLWTMDLTSFQIPKYTNSIRGIGLLVQVCGGTMSKMKKPETTASHAKHVSQSLLTKLPVKFMKEATKFVMFATKYIHLQVL